MANDKGGFVTGATFFNSFKPADQVYGSVPVRHSSAGIAVPTVEAVSPPRLGFLGMGWIGLQRMAAVHASGAAEVTALFDVSSQNLDAAKSVVPSARAFDSLEALLAHPMDGLVIATPSALHAEQAIAALRRGVAVFCQKPLGRNASETAAVVDAARAADRLLGVDFSYRQVEAFRRVREVVLSGDIGHVFAAELVFHNAYGPDKAWFYDRSLSGGGCLVDLGTHLVDLLLWVLGPITIQSVFAALFHAGVPLRGSAEVEDFAMTSMTLKGGVTVQLGCSWKLHAGQDAVISAAFRGTAGGVAARNVAGSFYDFVAERYYGTQREVLVRPPDDWGGRAVVDWALRLGRSNRFDPGALEVVRGMDIIDAIYAAGQVA